MTAAPDQSNVISTERSISIAIITSPGPPISAGVMKKPMARMKTISDPETTPCSAQRQIDPAEGVEAARAEAARRAHQAGIDRLHRA